MAISGNDIAIQPVVIRRLVAVHIIDNVVTTGRPLCIIGVQRAIVAEQAGKQQRWAACLEHVAENAERVIDDPDARCQYCERAGVPVFAYPGVIVDPSHAATPELAGTEPEVFELCAECINSSVVKRKDDFEASRIIARFTSDPQAAWHDYHRLPDIPLFLQRFDWPICCGTWCVFTGSPTDHAVLVAIQRTYRYWQQGLAISGRDFASEREPESITEISCFRCNTCGDRHYTDQFT